jgi:molecular chaperone DnaJ
MIKDYYQILGVERDASFSKIKASYRKLAKKYHPDSGKEDGEKFKEITEAYKVLSTPEKRIAHDSGLVFFNSIFRTDSVHSTLLRNAKKNKKFKLNCQIILQVRMDQVYLGSQISFDCNRKKECAHCQGEGISSNVFAKCFYCGGIGTLKADGKTLISCRACRGTGKKAAICEFCDGQGGTDELVKITVNIPHRVVSGSSFIVKGQGNLSINGKRGDILAVVRYPSKFEDVECFSDGTLSKTIIVGWEKALLMEDITFKVFSSCPLEERLKLDYSKPNGWVHIILGGGMAVNKNLMVKVWYNLPTNMSQEAREIIAREIQNAQPSRIG